MQDSGVGACLKHLVANESETDRNTMNSVVDEATLRELYLLPFEIAVEESDPWSIMAAYNDVNGVAATEQDHVNNEIVKGEWGYDGLIMSDWFATKTAGAGRQRRPRPGHARPGRAVGRRAGRRRRGRRGRRGGHRRPPAPAAAARRAGRRARHARATYPADLPAPGQPQRRRSS